MIDIFLFLAIFFGTIALGGYAAHRQGKAQKRAAVRKFGRRS